MDKLAIAYVTCDKYAHVWEEWYGAYLDLWDIDLPVYWCGETMEALDKDFTQLYYPQVEAHQWTSKLRRQIEQIKEDYIFVWLDDEIPQQYISREFAGLYLFMLATDADSVRIMERGTKANYNYVADVEGRPLYKLSANSRYRVSFSPNIYKKEFLLEILTRDESPWACELRSTGMYKDRDIYAYHIDGWYKNANVQ